MSYLSNHTIRFCILTIFAWSMMFMNRVKCFITIFWVVAMTICNGQPVPNLVNFNPTDYKAHPQNWSISQDNQGWIYAGNTDGLLVFNGTRWMRYYLPGTKTIRSVYIDKNRIYTGAYGEFGYWTRDVCGDHTYHSLLDLIPDHLLDKEEVWNITGNNGKIYFQSFSVLMEYDGNKVTSIQLPGTLMFLQIVNDKKLIPIIDSGIFELRGEKVEKLPGTEFFADKSVIGIIRHPEESDAFLIATSVHGVYTWKDGKVSLWMPQLKEVLSSAQVNKIIISTTGDIIIGTIRAGVLIISKSGQLKYQVNTSDGLQNNTVLSLALDMNNQLWTGLDKGISRISMDDFLLRFKDVSGTLGAIYSVVSTSKGYYIGTNQGVYFVSANNAKVDVLSSNFKLINGSQGQVWQLLKSGDDIICGHNDGTFLIHGDEFRMISDITGGWFNLLIEENRLLQGNYTGLALFERVNDTWKLQHKLEGYHQPVRQIVQRNKNQFWIIGPNTGLALITLDDEWKNVVDIKKYGVEQGLPSNLHLEMESFMGNLRIDDGHLHLVYHEASDSFSEDKTWKDERAFYFRQINDHVFAKIYSSSIEIVQPADTIVLPLRLNQEVNNVIALGEGRLALCLQDGFAVINLKESKTLDTGMIRVDQVIMGDRSYCISEPSDLELKAGFNEDISFFFSQPISEYSASHFFYRILPGNGQWLDIRNPGQITLEKLREGKHSIQITDGYHHAEVSFEIMPPWYRTWWVILLMILGVIALMIAVNRYIRYQVELKKGQLEQENQRLLREKFIQMENSRLTQENINKSKELANTTMHLIRKNELLQDIKSELNEIRKAGDASLSSKEFQVIIKQINENLTVEQDTNLFNANFEEVHKMFFKKLKAEYPMLKMDDLRLAAYLRMNFSSKEIAPLFALSIRGLENKRYRLRKKMNLPSDIDLNVFFGNYV